MGTKILPGLMATKEFRIMFISVFFIVQVLWIISSQFTGNRFFSWSPNDITTEYKIDLTIAGDKMPGDQIHRISGYRKSGFDDFPPDHITHILLKAFSQQSISDYYLQFSYRVNGGQWATKTYTDGSRN